MNYASSNPLNKSVCYHCKNRSDRHAISVIKSDDATEKLAKAMQDVLDDIYRKALLKGYDLPREGRDGENHMNVMVGAMIAEIGSQKVRAVALSGLSEGVIGAMQGTLGKDVVMLHENVPLRDFRTIINESLAKDAGDIQISVQNMNNARAVVPMARPAFPVGTCSAQKLLHFVVKMSLMTKTKIRKINMAEIFWKADGKSEWSTGELVPSCNTCNYMLPMMLCNYEEGDTRVPYP
jgi:hypothetical protein